MTGQEPLWDMDCLTHLGVVAFGGRGVAPVGTVTGVELVPRGAEHLTVVEVCDTLAQRTHQLNRAVRESTTLLKMTKHRWPCWMVKVASPTPLTGRLIE